MFKNTFSIYAISLILSTTKRSFEAIGQMLGRSGDTVKRWLESNAAGLDSTHQLAKQLFRKRKVLTLPIDDTLLHNRKGLRMS